MVLPQVRRSLDDMLVSLLRSCATLSASFEDQVPATSALNMAMPFNGCLEMVRSNRYTKLSYHCPMLLVLQRFLFTPVTSLVHRHSIDVSTINWLELQ